MSSQFLISFGAGMSNIALLTLITKWFVSANYIGLYSFFLFVPRVVLATYIGSLVDKSCDLKRLLLQSMFGTALLMLVIASSIYLELRYFWWLVFWAVLYEIVSSFYLPILTKLIVELFTKEDLNKLNASLTTAVTSANLFSGLVVAFLSSFIALEKFFFFDLGLYLVALGILCFLKVGKSTPQTSSSQTTPWWSGVGVVKTFLGQNKYLAPVFYGALLFNIALAPQSVYFTELAQKVFGNLKLVGIFDSLFVAGFLLGSVAYRLTTPKFKIHQYITSSLLLVSSAFLLLGLRQSALTYLGIGVLGVAIPLYNISMKTILQTKIPKAKLATVSNSYYALMNVTQPLGLLGLPYMISFLGINTSLLLIALGLFSLTSWLIVGKKISLQLDLQEGE